jgi:hypothetical protein
MTNGNRKGKEFELKVCKLLRRSGLDPQAKRSFQSGAHWSWKSDIYTSLDFAIECKKQESVHVYDWMDQAESQRKAYKPPVLIMNSNNRPILCVMKIDDWINLIKERNEYREGMEKKALEITT